MKKVLHFDMAGGILLLLMTVLSVAITNTSIGNDVSSFWSGQIKVTTAYFSFSFSFLHAINDGLMVIFFFLVGLEIKRELLTGELSTLRKALLPIIGAAGGILAPALLYLTFNYGGEGRDGWAIPVATDIAFVVGILTLLKNKIPASLRIFMTALAIVDDIGAIIIIAIFYTSSISVTAILFAAIILFSLLLANYIGIRSLWIYSGLGIVLWMAFLFSGVHATIAGVLLAFTIPASCNQRVPKFSFPLLKIFSQIKNHDKNQSAFPQSTPLKIMENALHPWVTFLIIPIFALANAGVVIDGELFEKAVNPISIGIITGLFMGKQIGIFGFTYAAIKLKLATKPAQTTYKKLYGISMLGGIGFTMSLFIANLSFQNSLQQMESAKVGILIASVASGIIGYILLRRD